jgi:twinkle protein
MTPEAKELVENADHRNLQKWGITQATCRHLDYRTTVNSKGEALHLAVYKDENGSPSFVKVRNTGTDGLGKDFYALGETKDSPSIYNAQCLGNGGKMIVIVEGEKDTLTVSQLWGNKFPVISPAHGAGTAKKDIAPWVDRISKFEKVIICLDMDDPGRNASLEVARLFPPGKAFIAVLPRKDPNEMHVAGEDQMLMGALHNAAAFRPDGIVLLSDLRSEMLSPVVTGRRYPLEFLNRYTYGRRDGEVIVLAAGTGVGKSDLLNQVAAHNIDTLERGGNFLPTAVFNYEAGPQVTGKGIVGKIMERRFHIPDPDGVYWTKKELEEAVDFVTQQCAKLFINDHQGATDWGSVKERIRYLKHTEDISDAFVDPMAALVATEDDERKALDRMMAESKMLAEELKIGLWFNTHVTRPSEGKSHEEGGRVALKHLRGSNAIGMWASFVFALERNQQGDEEERAVTTFRVLKDRFTGDSTGKTQGLRYNVLTGVLEVEDYNFEDTEDGPAEPPPV